MITCYLRYIIDPFKAKEFEEYGKTWIPLVEKFGGKHHGYCSDFYYKSLSSTI